MNSDRNAPIVCNVFKQWRQLTHLAEWNFPLKSTFHFHFKGRWAIVFIFIQILIEHSVSKQWRP